MTVGISYFVTALCLAMSSYHIVVAYVGTPIAEIHYPLHLLFVLLIVFWTSNIPEEYFKKLIFLLWNTILTIIVVLSCLYLSVYADYIQQRIMFISPLTITEILLSIGLIVAIFEAARRTVGMVLSVVVGVFLLYAIFGFHLPYPFWHRGYGFQYILETTYLTQDGLWGTPIAVTANYVFLFILFGSFLVAFGAIGFFKLIATRLTSGMTGGAAKSSVCSSALMGTLTGSSAANVVVTGSFTIPTMKAAGYRPHFAGAVEAVSSSGGQFMPPIMGSAAFVMMEFIGVPYATIMGAAIIPAILYFAAVFCMVDLEARRLGLRHVAGDETGQILRLLASYTYLVLPIFVLIWLLVDGATPTRSAFWAIIAVIFAYAAFVRPAPKVFAKACIEAMTQAPKLVGPVVVACACGGIIIGLITMTGLGLRMSSIVLTLAQDSLLLLLGLTMIAGVILGMGMPTTGAYIILAVLLAPGMIEFGVAPLAAHMFIMYCAGVSAITPPVALASFAAAGLAGSNPWRTSITAFRLGLASFIIPFMFVYGPPLLGYGSFIEISWSTLTALIGIGSLSIALIGWLFHPLSVINRLLFFAGSLCLIQPGLAIDAIGLAIILGAYLLSKAATGPASEIQAPEVKNK